MGRDDIPMKECRFCGVAIRNGDAIDETGTAHVDCVVAEHEAPADGERWRRLRQLWKLAKS